MGIYIKGMEIPKSCRGCFVNINTAAFPSCSLAENYDVGKALVVQGLGSDIRPAGCPLVEIPPHGRLIDADALMKLEVLPSDNWVFRAIEKAPTIIEAEEGEA